MGWGADNWIAVASCAQVGVLAAAAVYARRAVTEAQNLRSAQTRPYVVVYAETSKVARSLIDLVVENIGQTPAQDVSIRFSPKLESSMASAPNQDRVNDWVALSEGIPYLAPGQRMTHLLDSAISRYAKGSNLPRRYEVNVAYSEVGSRPRTDPYSAVYFIDVGVWYGSHYANELGIHDVGKALEDLSKILKGWSEGFDGLRVYNVDLEKYEEERMARYERMKTQHDDLAARLKSGADPEPPDDDSEDPENP
jgi:hypothetical protein